MASGHACDGLFGVGEEDFPRGISLGNQCDQLLISRGGGNVEDLRPWNDQPQLMPPPDLGGRQRQYQILARIRRGWIQHQHLPQPCPANGEIKALFL